jgi:hypothetical protein
MTTSEALKYLRMIDKSFNPATAPRFNKEDIEAQRNKAREAIALAIASLKEGENE